MPKNAEQRLQKLDQDLKSVISIYDVANKYNLENEKSERRIEVESYLQNKDQKLFDRTFGYNKSNDMSDSSQSGTLDDYKRPGLFTNRHSDDFYLKEGGNPTRRLWSCKKPGSAPSSSSVLTTISESDYLFQQSVESRSSGKFDQKRGFCPRETIYDDYPEPDWLSPNFPLTLEILMSPSKTLETANKVLKNNTFTSDDRKSEAKSREKEPGHLLYVSPTFCLSEKSDDSSLRAIQERLHAKEISPVNQIPCKTTAKTIPKKIIPSDNKTSKKIETKIMPLNKFRPGTPRKEIPKPRETTESRVFSKSFVCGKSHPELKKENSTSEISQQRSSLSKKFPKLEKLRSSIPEAKDRPKTHSGDTRPDTNKEPREKTKSWNQGEIPVSKFVKSIPPPPTKERQIDRVKPEIKSKIATKVRASQKADEKLDLEDVEEWMDGTVFKRMENEAKSKNGRSISNQGVQKPTSPTKPDEVELESQEITKMIEKNNEKLEKMKASKELALGIAKQLKNQYDEIKHSRKELLGRLHQVEADNEKLSSEIKEANASKMKLEIEMQGFRLDSNTMILRQDVKHREILEENLLLRSKMKDIELELLEKEKQLERIQKERRNEMKKPSPKVEEEIEKLRIQNAELRCKMEEINRVVYDRQLKLTKMEGRVYELEEKIIKQKQHLKQKTERLDETNKELESIRESSRELEEQVKTMRKSLDNFDHMHQTLVSRSMEYEHQLKSNEEVIKKLQDDNLKLKKEVENEKDSLLIKNKIIDDQQETIKQMREKAEEFKTLLKKNQSLERILNIEREEKLELQDAVERLKWRKDELKKKIKALEGNLLLAPQDVVRDLQKTQVVLHELENQVQIKQKEWEHHFQSLVREKEQACSVAEFATKKLMQTTTEFHKQSEAHKRLHRVLAENLAARELKLLEGKEKMHPQPTGGRVETRMGELAEIGPLEAYRKSPYKIGNPIPDILATRISSNLMECQLKKKGRPL